MHGTPDTPPAFSTDITLTEFPVSLLAAQKDRGGTDAPFLFKFKPKNIDWDQCLEALSISSEDRELLRPMGGMTGDRVGAHLLRLLSRVNSVVEREFGLAFLRLRKEILGYRFSLAEI